jgi:hypothetical protein
LSLPEKSSSDLPGQSVAEPAMIRIRDLGVYERLYYLCSLDHPKNFCVAADVDGDVSPETLPATFALLQRKHPLLNAQIHDRSAFGGKPGPAFYECNRPIDVAIRPLADDEDWMKEAERQLDLRFNPSSGPLMRATVFHSPGRAQIVLTFHHAIADGMSGAFVLRDLMIALSGQPIGTLAAKPSCETLLVRHPEFNRSCDTRQPQRLDVDALRAIGEQASHQANHAARPKITAVSLDRVFTRRLQDSARAQGTTVHGALAAAEILAANDHRPGIPCTIVSPLDLREMLGVDDGSCGVYIGVSRHVHLAANGETFWTLARQATDEIALAKTVKATSAFMKSIMANVPATAAPDIAIGLMAARHRDAMISNLGRLSLRQMFGGLRLSAFWGPIYHAQAPQSRFLGVATMGGCLRMVETTPAGMTPLVQSVRQWLEVAINLVA